MGNAFSQPILNDPASSYFWRVRSIRIRSRIPYCQNCGSFYKTQVHHMNPQDCESIDRYINTNELIVLCVFCHAEIHNDMYFFGRSYRVKDNSHLFNRDHIADMMIDDISKKYCIWSPYKVMQKEGSVIVKAKKRHELIIRYNLEDIMFYTRIKISGNGDLSAYDWIYHEKSNTCGIIEKSF